MAHPADGPAGGVATAGAQPAGGRLRAGVVPLPGVLMLAQFSRHLSSTGSYYTFASRSLGGRPGFLMA